MHDFEEPQISRRIAMVAHDNKKVELLGWAEFNVGQPRHHQLFATGTTGTMLQYELGLKVHCFLSGPLGGDQQIGAKIAEGDIDMVIFRTFDLLVASCALCRARVEPTKQSLPVLPPTPLSCRAVEDCPRTKLA